MLPEVANLGQSADGLKPSQSKVEAVEEALVLTNVSELKCKGASRILLAPSHHYTSY